MVATVRRVETRDEALIRLAGAARERGIQIFSYDLDRSVEFYATSTSRPGTLHRITLWSCTCPGFIRHQRCVHYARLLDEIGELPPLPEPPDPAALAQRRAARGGDWHYHNEGHARAWLASLIERQPRRRRRSRG